MNQDLFKVLTEKVSPALRVQTRHLKKKFMLELTAIVEKFFEPSQVNTTVKNGMTILDPKRKQTGQAVMTEGESQKYDSFQKRG